MKTTTRTITTRTSPGRRRPGVIAAAGCAAALTVLAGCGGDDEEAAEPAPPAEQPAQGADDGASADQPTDDGGEAGEDAAGDATAEPTDGGDDGGAEDATAEPTDGGDAGEDATAEPTDDAGASEVVELRDGTIAGLELPAPVDEVRETLTAQWGEPDVDGERAGCPLGDPDTLLHELEWGELVVYGQYLPGEEPVIQTWQVVGNDLPEGLDTPFDIIPGTPWDLAVAAVPSAEVGSGLGGEPEITSPEREGLAWSGDADETEVTSASYNAIACE